MSPQLMAPMIVMVRAVQSKNFRGIAVFMRSLAYFAGKNRRQEGGRISFA